MWFADVIQYLARTYCSEKNKAENFASHFIDKFKQEIFNNEEVDLEFKVMAVVELYKGLAKKSEEVQLIGLSGFAKRLLGVFVLVSKSNYDFVARNSSGYINLLNDSTILSALAFQNSYDFFRSRYLSGDKQSKFFNLSDMFDENLSQKANRILQLLIRLDFVKRVERNVFKELGYVFCSDLEAFEELIFQFIYKSIKKTELIDDIMGDFSVYKFRQFKVDGFVLLLNVMKNNDLNVQERNSDKIAEFLRVILFKYVNRSLSYFVNSSLSEGFSHRKEMTKILVKFRDVKIYTIEDVLEAIEKINIHSDEDVLNQIKKLIHHLVLSTVKEQVSSPVNAFFDLR